MAPSKRRKIELRHERGVDLVLYVSRLEYDDIAQARTRAANFGEQGEEVRNDTSDQPLSQIAGPSGRNGLSPSILDQINFDEDDDDADYYTVRSTSEPSRRYVVKRLSCSSHWCNSSCDMRCCQCSACYDRFTCTCPDNEVNLCKHIHAVCLYEEHLRIIGLAFGSVEDSDDDNCVEPLPVNRRPDFLSEIKYFANELLRKATDVESSLLNLSDENAVKIRNHLKRATKLFNNR